MNSVLSGAFSCAPTISPPLSTSETGGSGPRAPKPKRSRYHWLHNIPKPAFIEFRNAIIDSNQAAAAAFGAESKEALIGTDALLRVAKQDRKAAAHRVSEALRGHEVDRAEERFVRCNGSEFPVSVSAGPIPRGHSKAILVVFDDITEYRERVDELRLMTAGARKLAESLSLAQGFVRMLDGTIVVWTAGAEKLYGYTRDEAVGRCSHQLLRTEFPCPLDQILSDLVAAEEWKGELRHRHKSGDWMTVASHWVMQRDHAGNVAAILEVNNDLHPPHQPADPDATRGRKNPELEAVADAVPAAALTMAADSSCSYCNRRFLALTGLAREEVLRTQWTAAVHPDDRDRVFSSCMASVRSGQDLRTQCRIRTADGSYKALLFQMSRVQGSDEAKLGWLAMFVDPDPGLGAPRAETAAATRYRNICDSNMIGVFETDGDRVLAANRMMLAALGYSEPDLNRGAISWAGVLGGEQRTSVNNAMHGLGPGASFAMRETVFLRQDGSAVPVLLGMNMLSAAPPLWLGLASDLTDRKARDARLIEARRMEWISQLAGGIAHNLNNVLVGVTGGASLILGHLAGNTVATGLACDILHAGERAADLAAQLLAFAGKGKLYPQLTNVAEFVGEFTRSHEEPVPPNVELRSEIAEGIPPIWIDRGQLRQLLSSVTTNAIEAIGDRTGTVCIRVSAVRADPGAWEDTMIGRDISAGDFVSIEIEDNGAGMSLATRLQIFDPFFSTKFIGRGLGLAAVGGMVRGYHGAIAVKSWPGQGTAMRILLPAESSFSTGA